MALPPLNPNLIIWDEQNQAHQNNQLKQLASNRLIIIEHSPYLYSIAYGNVIFAGSTTGKVNKGPAIINYMARGLLPSGLNFDHFIYVDNDLKYVNSVIDFFTRSGMRHKLIAIHYPQKPILNQKDLCTSDFDIFNCFGSLNI
jgi:hypothetical protein